MCSRMPTHVPGNDEQPKRKCERTRCNGEAQDPHTCPFGEELRGDKTLCTCCESCEYGCAMDI